MQFEVLQYILMFYNKKNIYIIANNLYNFSNIKKKKKKGR